MKIKRYNYQIVATLVTVATFFIHGYSQTSSEDPVMSGTCVLNFTSYPYEPSGECAGSGGRQRIKQWDGVATTVCCGNALETFTEALAIRAATQPNDAVFLPKDLWSNCTGPFLRQPSISAASCKFDDAFFYGTSHCSKLTVQTVRLASAYRSAFSACGAFESFSDNCTGCAAAVVALRDELLELSDQRDREKKSEKAMCSVAAVISLASERILNRSHTEDFFRCLHLLEQFDPDYIKIKNSLAHILVALVVAVTAIMLIVVLVKHVTKKKKRKPGKSREYASTWSGLYRFSREEIHNAISYRRGERKSLGQGSAGHVYKGILPSGQAIAVKHINPNSHPDSFKREVEGLSKIRHPNLVCLFGFCMEDDGNYLVYEYCAGGNLAQQLLRKTTLLTWGRRVRILRDCALALKHLHHFIDGCIVHRDIKLTNILLTETLEPKLSDFGLARVMNVEESNVFTAVRGTIGYMDPEYMSNAKLTSASDIYSFGIVILQLLSGKKVIDFTLDARDQLTRMARDVCLGSRPPDDLEDQRLKGKVNKEDFKAILNIAVLCVAKSSKDRPNIEILFNELDRAWRNTDDYALYMLAKKAKQDPSTSSPTRTSTSAETTLPV